MPCSLSTTRGKNKEQRGASRREDLLETVIKLEPAESAGPHYEGGACFNIRFTKLRGERPKPDQLRVALEKDDVGNFNWTTDGVQHAGPAYLKVVQAIAVQKPATQIALAKSLSLTKQAVHKQIKIAQDKGLIEASGVELTAKGKKIVEKHCVDLAKYDESLLSGLVWLGGGDTVMGSTPVDAVVDQDPRKHGLTGTCARQGRLTRKREGQSTTTHVCGWLTS